MLVVILDDLRFLVLAIGNVVIDSRCAFTCRSTFILMNAASCTNPVPVGNSPSDILVVQRAQYWHGQRSTEGLYDTRDRRVFLQGQVRARLVVIFLI
jgi:hypothetical protein